MQAISVKLHIPFWCSFRQTIGINVHITYPIPPKTTCYGLIANALGLAQDDYSLMDDIKIAVCLDQEGERIESHSIIMKKDRNDQNAMSKHNYYRVQVTKQKFIKPAYRLFIASSNTDLLDRIFESLKNPARILYLGESDDLVELKEIKRIDLFQTDSKIIHSTLKVGKGEVIGPSRVVKMPSRFNSTGRDQFSLEQETVHFNPELKLAEPIPCFQIDQTYLTF